MIRDGALQLGIRHEAKLKLICIIDKHPETDREGFWLLVNVLSGVHEQSLEMAIGSRMRISIKAHTWTGITRIATANGPTFSLDVRVHGHSNQIIVTKELGLDGTAVCYGGESLGLMQRREQH